MQPGRPYGLIPDGALAIESERIAWIGPRDALSAAPSESARDVVDAGGRLITPGLIDCHTHLVYAGNRAREFEMRLEGATYEQIARSGGGILATVAATRAASFDDLLRDASRRIAGMLRCGTTTVEIKSGYGLDLETETRILRVARELGRRFPIDVRTTYLGAHAIPPEFSGDADGYVAFILGAVLPVVAAERLADAVDAFCERIAFTPEQCRRVFASARALHLAVKLHAEQLSDSGGAALAAEYGALSADHLEYAGDETLKELADAGTVGVLLPGAAYFLREQKRPPVATMRALKIPIALATDCNPGTSPLLSLPLAMNLACTLFGLTCEEALRGTTVHAARALGVERDVGTLAPGMRADFVVWDAHQPAELVYPIGEGRARTVVIRGKPVLDDAEDLVGGRR